ncbi:MAG TPA: alpha/beta hydrolase, partial [bacterium]
LARLAERERFPALADVVIAGHSAGGQFTHRYAILGRGDAALTAKGIHVRYVIANPSSYAYFDRSRPSGDGFARYDGNANGCLRYNRWRYGMEDLPHYAQGGAKEDFEAGYVARDVWYLLGTADVDPLHAQLDHNCGAEAEGPQRLARGQAYTRYMQARHPDLKHLVWLIPKVGHEADRMFLSPCGMAALFDRPGCPPPQ